MIGYCTMDCHQTRLSLMLYSLLPAEGADRDEVESISVSGAAIKPAASVKSLGFTLDSRLSLDQHITNVCKSC